MQSAPEISEIDINPLMVHAKGEGATALDALIVVAADGSLRDLDCTD
jgi:acetate---CoA ligase (ADP-forming)